MYKLNIPFISEKITYFIESAKKIKDQIFENLSVKYMSN